MRRLLAVILGLLTASEARADLPPSRLATKHALATHRIEVKEAYRDYVFVVTRLKWRGQPPNLDLRRDSEYVELVPGRPLTLIADYREDPTLLIVPKAAAEPYETAAELETAIRAGLVSGVVQREFPERETVPSWGGNKTTLVYRVRRNGSGGLEIVRTSWDPLWQWYVAAGGLTVAVVLGGFWLLRRKRRKRSTGDAR